MKAKRLITIGRGGLALLALWALGCSKTTEGGAEGDGAAGNAAQAGAGGAAGRDLFGNVNAGTGGGGGGGGDGAGTGGVGGMPNISVTGGCGKLEVRNLDLLFMVDNSGSMKEEQTALQRELPLMIRRLTTGDIDGDGESDLLPIEELHLGVVSSDLGLVGINGIEQCEGLGDDGLLQHLPSPEVPDCADSYPSFLTYRVGDDAAQVAVDFSCISALGTNGCGFEQQLETTLKALWPASDDRVNFLPDPQGFGSLGHGDVENAGFLRPSTGAMTSLLAVVLVTDEDDCSSNNTSFLRPPAYLDPNNPMDAALMTQGLNVRCSMNEDSLYPLERYVDGLKALRPDSEGLIVFGAIVGVPAALVEPGVLSNVDFADEDSREAFYDALLDDETMQVEVDTLGTPSPDDDTIRASCNTDNGRAYPPRRIVETARGFGRDSVVQSICQDDFGPAIDAILEAITRASNSACIVQ